MGGGVAWDFLGIFFRCFVGIYGFIVDMGYGNVWVMVLIINVDV